MRRALKWTAASLGLIAAGYACVAALTWFRYGRPSPPAADEQDRLMDRFMPEYDVAERHHVRVSAPAELVLAAAKDVEIERSGIIRAIFRTRELVLGAGPETRTRPKGLMADMTSLGWRVLAEEPGREVVMGAVTQPWLAEVVFRGLPPDEFLAFREPGFVKIVWTLRADHAGGQASIFRTETRVMTTDPVSRAKFRWYWARFSPGIVLIRRLMLGLLKEDAERRVAVTPPVP